MPDDFNKSRRFDVALSFPGEHRAFVAEVAECLSSEFGKERVLYDDYYEAEFARPDLDLYLPNLYRTESELIVIFLCPEYSEKRWCRLEWRSIRQLIATVDSRRIMFLRYGFEGDLSDLGIFQGDGVLKFKDRPATEIAAKIRERFLSEGGSITPRMAARGSGPGSGPAGAKFDISRIDRYAPAELIGREPETKILADAWEMAVNGEPKRPHVITFVALGGEGKTSLVAKWAADLAFEDWPGCDAAFAWSFYSQGTREQMAASSDLFLKEALLFFGDSEMANSAQSAFDKGRRLATLVGERRALLILDGLEPLQYSPTSPTPGELKDQGISALLKGLAVACSGLCVVTTRYSLPDLRAYWRTSGPEYTLDRLSTTAGVSLLRSLGVTGAQAEFETLVEDVRGHALTLNLLGGFLRRAFHADIRQRDRVRFEKADEKIQGGHAFRTIAAYARWLLEGGDEGRREVAILRIIGLFDRPADAGCLAALRGESIPDLTEPLFAIADEDWEFSLSGLEDMRLLTINRGQSGELFSLDAHPLIREYFASELRSKSPESWRAAHRRIYEHLCETTEDQPDTLEGLQPLYQAVAHGCLAGMQETTRISVYRDRILRGTRGDGFYSQNMLGAFGSELGAVACFFDTPWTRVSPSLDEPSQAWFLNAAAFCLRALGRLAEALQPTRIGLSMHVGQENWLTAARAATNLSELELTLGDVSHKPHFTRSKQ